MTHSKYFVAALFALVGLSGCESLTHRPESVMNLVNFGMTQQEVIAAIGAPDTKTVQGKYECYQYNLVNNNGHALGNSIYFDSNRRVVQTEPFSCSNGIFLHNPKFPVE
ncbi:hypothetical protein [Burkholderia metallica]|uniref:hypothetical protein n=1 Tax=Burkholderia metallica TaxID=488729 RepID=UPI001CF3D3C5|nr:hypothetical protein [Burkholderia metallica]MCA8017729.1 hypothetical protein [Burkholderia metallica]